MGEELTRELLHPRSFEDRVFARFDAADGRFIDMETHFSAMDGRFDAMQVRFDAIDSRFVAVDARFAAIDARFDAVEKRLDTVDFRLESVDGRVQALEAKALDTKPIWERALAEILQVKTGVEDLNRKIDVLSQHVLQVRADQRRVEKSMAELESRVQ